MSLIKDVIFKQRAAHNLGVLEPWVGWRGHYYSPQPPVPWFVELLEEPDPPAVETVAQLCFVPVDDLIEAELY